MVMHDRHDLTDEQWGLLEPHLPRCGERGGRPWRDHRQVIDAILWRTRSGSPWRDVPAGYGHWKTAYNRHRRWSGDGTWEALLRELQRGCDAADPQWSVGVDSTVVRAHQDAAGAPHVLPSDVPVERLAVALEGHVSGSPVRHTGGLDRITRMLLIWGLLRRLLLYWRRRNPLIVRRWDIHVEGSRPSSTWSPISGVDLWRS